MGNPKGSGVEENLWTASQGENGGASAGEELKRRINQGTALEDMAQTDPGRHVLVGAE